MRGKNALDCLYFFKPITTVLGGVKTRMQPIVLLQNNLVDKLVCVEHLQWGGKCNMSTDSVKVKQWCVLFFQAKE